MTTFPGESHQFNKVLIIEDEPDISDYLYETLAMTGYKVWQAYDGLDGLEKAKHLKPNLILLDVMIPKMNGIEVCRKIRSDSDTRSMRIIFITAKGSLEEKLEGFQAGANDFIVKPFSSSELLARIEAHLSVDVLAHDLELSEKKYRQLVEHSPDGILLFSPDLRLIFANSRLEDISPKLKGPATQNEHISSLATRSPIFSEIARLLTKVRETRMILTRVISSTSKGQPSYIEIRGIPSELQGALTPMIQVVIRDVTEKFKMEKIISRAEKINSLGILTAGIAHEINNPLTGISNAVHLLKKNKIDPDKKAEIIELIFGNINRISRIIDDLRFFSRLERYETGTFEIVSAIDEMIKLLRFQRESDNVELQFNHQGTKLYLAGNKSQFQQLIVNLLLNSFQAIFETGTITIDLKQSSDSPLMATLEVKDTGCGIPEDEIEQVFNPFFTTKREWKGTGLGLAVTYRIVQQLKGNISISSKVDQGTTFTIVLPLQPAP